MSAESIQRVVQPIVTQDGQRAPGLKFGDPRVMALMLSRSAFGCLLLSDSLRLETGTVLRAPGRATISPGTDSYERTTNSIEYPLNEALQTIDTELDRFFDQAFPDRKAA